MSNRNCTGQVIDIRTGKRRKIKHIARIEPSHPALQPYYENVTTLRHYILARTSNSSYARKRRLQKISPWTGPNNHVVAVPDRTSPTLSSISSHNNGAGSPDHNNLSKLLDTTIIGYSGRISDQSCYRVAPQPYQNIQQLSQKLRSTLKDGPSQGNVSQADILDFAVGHLFNTVYRATRFPSHLLCNGFAKSAPELGDAQLWTNGLYCTFPNCNAIVMQSGAWPALLKLLGKDGDHVMLDLIFHCAVYVPLEAGTNNLCQLSGVQLCEMPLLTQVSPVTDTKLIPAPLPKQVPGPILNRLSDIKIMRNRMCYARPGLNARGAVRLGLQHIHVFNRYADTSNPKHIVHVMKYIFPRQFGLHNVFTCKPDRRETIQAQKDYTMREQEIATVIRQKQSRRRDMVYGQHLPRRLRGQVLKLITKLLRRHANCAYVELLKHHCPVEFIEAHADTAANRPVPSPMEIDDAIKSYPSKAPAERDIVDLAIPHRHVYAFCRAALLKVLPLELFDSLGTGDHNLGLILKHVRDFILARKRESLSLHFLLQGIKFTNIPWLIAPGTNQTDNVAMSDLTKRKELFGELLYYIFDSILIPLIRSNFHVTESSTHTHKLFYFRHDVWRKATEIHLSTLRMSMFEDFASSKNVKTASLADPYGHMRLVPKGTSFRSIMNLKRKPMIYQKGKLIMGPRSVNMVLEPVYAMLKHEKQRQPERLGSSLFSIDEMYPRLKRFRLSLEAGNLAGQQLYFAKVDVSNCFDTIPQNEVLDLVHDLCDQIGYATSRHAQVSARMHQGSEPNISKKFRKREPARSLQDTRAFKDHIDNGHSASRCNTVFVEQSVPRAVNKEKLMKLLDEHVSHNKVKLGKKFLRQKCGIPQGSIISSILCNFFYGQFESECLSFLEGPDSLVLRMLDDFLLITLDQDKASRFLQIMYQGNPRYGITIKPQKSLVNFPLFMEGCRVPCCTASAFPYCGKTINTKTLEIGRDRERQDPERLSESLSIERSKAPGEAFHRLTLDALKRQLHAQFIDAELNSCQTILDTLYQDFAWAALRMHAYIRGLGVSKVPVPALIMRTIEDLATMTVSILTSPSKLKTDLRCDSRVTALEVRWLCYKAFQITLRSKQCWFGQVLVWLERQLEVTKPRNARMHRRLQAVVTS